MANVVQDSQVARRTVGLYTRAMLLSLVALIIVLVNTSTVFADIKVAFIADQGTSKNATRVLELISNEGTDLLLIQGDLGYQPGAAMRWELSLKKTLGLNFPVLSVVGNHENHEWEAYKLFQSARINRIPDLKCTGDIGVKAICDFKGLSVVQVAPGITEVEGVKASDGYPEFIVDNFKNSPAKWRICSWHKNQSDMQIGNKSDETGWAVYESCRKVGAMVATGHQHSYSRTHLLSNFEQKQIVNKNNHLVLSEGQSFAFVSGLGGRKTRKQEKDGEWWAAKYSRSQNAKHGALFCSYSEQYRIISRLNQELELTVFGLSNPVRPQAEVFRVKIDLNV